MLLADPSIEMGFLVCTYAGTGVQFVRRAIAISEIMLSTDCFSTDGSSATATAANGLGLWPSTRRRDTARLFIWETIQEVVAS